MKRFAVKIVDRTYGEWIIDAENETEAKDEAEKRLMDGDITWKDEDDGSIEVYEVEEV